MSIIQFQAAVDPDEELDRISLQEELGDCLSMLPQRQAKVIYLRFFEGMTFKQIGEQMGFKGPRARDLYASAIRRLRHPRLSRRLRPFYGVK